MSYEQLRNTEGFYNLCNLLNLRIINTYDRGGNSHSLLQLRKFGITVTTKLLDTHMDLLSEYKKVLTILTQNPLRKELAKEELNKDYLRSVKIRVLEDANAPGLRKKVTREGKPCNTPFGSFDSMSAAAKVADIPYPKLRYYCSRQINGYRFI